MTGSEVRLNECLGFLSFDSVPKTFVEVLELRYRVSFTFFSRITFSEWSKQGGYFKCSKQEGSSKQSRLKGSKATGLEVRCNESLGFYLFDSFSKTFPKVLEERWMITSIFLSKITCVSLIVLFVQRKD